MRTGGKFSGIMTLLFDFAKGYFPVLVTINFFGFDHNYYLISGLACFIGHLYPVWLKFKGGKGVATFLGILLALSMKLFFIVFLLMVAVIMRFRYVSVGSIFGAIIAALLSFFLCETPQTYLVVGLAILIVLKHTENIQKLLKKTENKLNF
ncbi:UNVERIFIED_CONTAM: hypothetical protein GTU68_038730 [Idotea baltica]|nr:hypothetical protein [Idotea baltica]